MDGELQVLTGYEWQDWLLSNNPAFNDNVLHYRRKPKKPVKPQPGEKWKHPSGTVVVVTGETSGVLIEKGTNSIHGVGDLRHDWTFCGETWTKVS